PDSWARPAGERSGGGRSAQAGHAEGTVPGAAQGEPGCAGSIIEGPVRRGTQDSPGASAEAPAEILAAGGGTPEGPCRGGGTDPDGCAGEWHGPSGRRQGQPRIQGPGAFAARSRQKRQARPGLPAGCIRLPQEPRDVPACGPGKEPAPGGP